MKTSKQTVFYASILLVSLHLVLGSCEKELPEAGSGEKIPVRFLLQQASYGEGESLTRSSASGTGEEASSVVPLGDNLYLHASLEVAPPEPTRAPLTFNSSAQIIVAAYEGSSTTATASAVYKESSGSITPQSSALSLEPGTYTFVAYSYNSTSPLTHIISETVSLSPDDDDDGKFLWGNDIDKTISAGSNAVTITMKRRLSKASVKVMTPSTGGPYTIDAISDIAIGPGHSVNMSLKDGSFTSTANDILQQVPLLASTTYPSPSVETESRLVCTNGSPTTTVTIGSITINSNTYTDLTANFNKELEPNKSYILRVDIRRSVAWAGSNVYWDGTKLTFKPYGYVGEENNYQGLFFKWGSLVGTSPIAGSWDEGTAHYHPNYDASTSTNSWSISYGGSYDAIPYISADIASEDRGRNKDYFGILIDRDDLDLSSTKALYAEGKGDICRYLSHIGAVSGNYRMPTMNEFQYGNNDSSNPAVSYSSANWTNAAPIIDGYWSRIGTTSPNEWIAITTPTDPTGQYAGLVSGANYKGCAIFPASGYNYGDVGGIGYVGAYSSSSPVVYAGVRHVLEFYSDGLFFNEFRPMYIGPSVRCVLEE
ncbi:MAG: fimbrillin family protein [Dysgonamonadaceae bacterium]|jgi:hypothetical protein|nr:fimbrillin family protein [Dysgonamonadaceae bacterium]